MFTATHRHTRALLDAMRNFTHKCICVYVCEHATTRNCDYKIHPQFKFDSSRKFFMCYIKFCLLIRYLLKNKTTKIILTTEQYCVLVTNGLTLIKFFNSNHFMPYTLRTTSYIKLYYYILYYKNNSFFIQISIALITLINFYYNTCRHFNNYSV